MPRGWSGLKGVATSWGEKPPRWRRVTICRGVRAIFFLLPPMWRQGAFLNSSRSSHRKLRGSLNTPGKARHPYVGVRAPVWAGTNRPWGSEQNRAVDLQGMKEAIPSGYFANPVMPSSPPRQTDRFAIPPGGAYHADAGSIMQVQGGLTPAPHPLHQEAGGPRLAPTVPVFLPSPAAGNVPKPCSARQTANPWPRSTVSSRLSAVSTLQSPTLCLYGSLLPRLSFRFAICFRIFHDCPRLRSGNDGTYRLDLDCDRELVIALRAR